MSDEDESYETFLDTWEPSRQLQHATLATNLGDPVIMQRLLDTDGAEGDAVARATWSKGKKVMDGGEMLARLTDFFERKQPEWSRQFRDLVVSNGVPKDKFDLIAEAFRTDWVDGLSRRQGSRTMMALKASIRDHDRVYHRRWAGRFVLNTVPDTIQALLTPAEVKILFEANSDLLHGYIPEYQDLLDRAVSGLANLSVRRGVYMPRPDDLLRRELHYLSSYSLALGPVEQFAQNWTPQTRTNGEPVIFSAPLPAVQQRVVAFAPFIEGMDLSQLELVVAPPVEEVPLEYLGEFGDIHEYTFL